MVRSDLSHFHDLTTARELDAATAKAIEALAPERLGPDNACGFLPIAGLLWKAGRSGGRVRALELRTSADVGAPADSVVGYGAFELREEAAA